MHSLISKLPDIVGIAGVIIVLIAYYLLNVSKTHSSSLNYLLMNLIGAIMVLYSLCYSWNLASVIIEIAWILISLLGIYRSVFKRT